MHAITRAPSFTMIVLLVDLIDIACLCRRFLTEVSKDSASRFQLMRSAYPPKAYDRAQTQESSLLGLAEDRRTR